MTIPREILVRAPNWTGDVIMATPGFRALRAGFPEARITLHARAEHLPLLDGAPWFDARLPVRSHGRRGPAQLQEGLGLRRQGFDLGLCLPDSWSAAALMRLAGVKRVVGYARGLRFGLLDVAVPVSGPRRDGAGSAPMLARERQVLGLVEAAGCPVGGTVLELFVTPDEDAEAAAALRAAGVGAGERYAVLAPGASYGPSKLWPAEYFGVVAERIAAQGVRPVLVGSPSERPLATRERAGAGSALADLTGATGLGGLKAVVRGAAAMLCNDAGARHVAVALGVPAVVLMGPTSLEKTNLNLENVIVLSEDVPCRPCYERTCPIDHRCMTRIEPERALAAMGPALGSVSAVGGVA